MERPTSSWASRSGRRPRFTESGWSIDDEDFLTRRTVNSDGSNSHRMGGGGGEGWRPSGGRAKDPLTRTASDGSSRARKREDITDVWSLKRSDWNNGSGGVGSMTADGGEQARLRAVSRLGSQATAADCAPAPMAPPVVSRVLPRKLHPIPMAADEEEEEEEGEGEDSGGGCRRIRRLNPDFGERDRSCAAVPRRRLSLEDANRYMVRRGPKELEPVNNSPPPPPHWDQDSAEKASVNMKQILRPIQRN